eukprot:5588884-Prymnesium_polylepis.1
MTARTEREASGHGLVPDWLALAPHTGALSFAEELGRVGVVWLVSASFRAPRVSRGWSASFRVDRYPPCGRPSFLACASTSLSRQLGRCLSHLLTILSAITAYPDNFTLSTRQSKVILTHRVHHRLELLAAPMKNPSSTDSNKQASRRPLELGMLSPWTALRLHNTQTR